MEFASGSLASCFTLGFKDKKPTADKIYPLMKDWLPPGTTIGKRISTREFCGQNSIWRILMAFLFCYRYHRQPRQIHRDCTEGRRDVQANGNQSGRVRYWPRRRRKQCLWVLPGIVMPRWILHFQENVTKAMKATMKPVTVIWHFSFFIIGQLQHPSIPGIPQADAVFFNLFHWGRFIHWGRRRQMGDQTGLWESDWQRQPNIQPCWLLHHVPLLLLPWSDSHEDQVGDASLSAGKRFLLWDILLWYIY